MAYLSAAEADGSLDLISALQELDTRLGLDLHIVCVNSRRKPDFFNLDNFLVLTLFLIALYLFEAILPVIHYFAYGRIHLRGDLHKVKVSIRFRGRQITHGDIGVDVMNTFYEMVKDSANIDRPAKQEGRNMFMVLTPKN